VAKQPREVRYERKPIYRKTGHWDFKRMGTGIGYSVSYIGSLKKLLTSEARRKAVIVTLTNDPLK